MALKTSTTTDDILALANIQIIKSGLVQSLVSSSNAVISDKGTISIGITTPPTNYGNNEGVFIGYDNGPQVSFYSNENNYLKWDGTKLLIQATNFTLDSAGNITANNADLSGSITALSGSIGGWAILESTLWSGSDGSKVILDSSGLHPSFSAGSANSDTAPFRVYKDGLLIATSACISGSINAQSGSIAGWAIGDTSIYKNNTILSSTGEISVGTGNNILKISSIDPNGYALWAGNNDPAFAPFSVTRTGNVKMSAGEITGNFQSENFVTGISGWRIQSNGKAEFEDAKIRGTIETAVFETQKVSVQSGTQWISEGTALAADLSGSPVSTTITVVNAVFNTNDYLRIKDIMADEWMLVTGEATVVNGGYQYPVQRGLNGTFGTFRAGQAIVRLGQLAIATVVPENLGSTSACPLGDRESTDFLGTSQATTGGFLVLEGGRATGPYFGVTTRIGSEYNALQDIIRLGLLKDFSITPAFGEVYGIVIGDSNRFFSYTREDGLKISNTSGNSVVIDDDGLTLDLAEFKGLTGTTPTPETGYYNLYFRDDGFIYSKDSSGTEVKIAGGGSEGFSGSVITLTKVASTQSTPASGSISLYAKTDDNFYMLNSFGVETPITGSRVSDFLVLSYDSGSPSYSGSLVLYSKTDGSLYMGVSGNEILIKEGRVALDATSLVWLFNN